MSQVARSVVAAFRSAGRVLWSAGLVHGTEGNLSTFDGRSFVITRTGSPLGALSTRYLVAGGLDDELADASSDVDVHRAEYRERGPGAFVHAHPAGTVPEDGGGPGRHGVYRFGSTLGEAADAVVREARALG
jgi:ribulose-5-phosphate 4-epimerase/fuculose-1-phosphate aldolase